MPVLLAKLWSVIPRLFAWPPAPTPADGDRAGLDRAARVEHDLPVRHRDREHPVLVRLPLRLRQGALLRGGRVRRRARRPPRGQGAGRAARVPLARRARAAARRPRRDAARARRRPRRRGARPADDQPARAAGARSAAARRRCSSRTPGSRSAARCAASRSSRRGARAGSRSTRRRRAPRSPRTMVGAGYRLVLRRRAAGGRADAAPSCSRCRRRRTRSRSAASRAGRRARPGPACRSSSWRGAPACADPARAARRVAAARGRAAPGDARAGQVADSRSLLALRVGGADLSLDHGYPARIIVPGLPGRAQHEVGRGARRSAHEGAATAHRRCTCSRTSRRWRWPPGRCCRRSSSAARSGSCCG